MNIFGSNSGYVDEVYARYLRNPEEVSEAWRDFFLGYEPGLSPASKAIPETPAKDGAPRRAEGDTSAAEPIRGIAARIVENMTASLAVPSATSARTIPVKVLEENRRLLNQHQQASFGPKISYTHLISWAITQALARHPAMNTAFVEVEDVPSRLPRKEIHLGLAIDLERKGERLLLVPNIKNVQAMDFPTFVASYDGLVARARAGKLQVEDFQGTTVTLTNPGTIGTHFSAPRLMPGQSAIIGTGAINYPAEYSGMAPSVISELGISKVMTATSTYDHRVIQGAESGAFLSSLEKLILGEEGFYQRIFRELGVPSEPVRWSGDQNPTIFSSAGSTEAIEKQARVIQLIRSYRVRGHLWADLDPLGYTPKPCPELELSEYGLTAWDLDRKFIALGLAGQQGTMTLREMLDILRETYCRHLGVEYMHIQNRAVRTWLQERMEKTRNAEPLPRPLQQRILYQLNAAEAFESFLHKSYLGHKRFSLEGAETLVPMLDSLFNFGSGAGIEEVIIGMAHRGRLNVLASCVGKSYSSIFREFEGTVDPTSMHGSGDVKYHLGASGIHHAPGGKTVTVTVASNPSHLEAVDPVVEGMVRARQDRKKDLARERVLAVLVHGDAAFAGQGVVAETLNLSELKGYRTGGTIHIVVNNQIGFTTGPADARSSLYCTDVAKMVRAPIIHVNGDYPEDAARAVKIALEFRQAFKRDVVIDLVCYRRYGHNETDDPSYTQPIIYARIEKHRPVRKLYTEQLLRRGDLDPETAEKMLEDYRQRLESAYREVRGVQAGEGAEEKEAPAVPAPASGAREEPSPSITTAVPRPVLVEILSGLDRTPEGFEKHPKLAKQLAGRRERAEAGKLDWAHAEALAFGSLVLDGVPVRLSGQDSGRGTFSQRHAVLYDVRTGAQDVPLSHLREGQAPFQVFDSLLSELAVLGFEYGYSVEHPEALVLWEAQFGDFVNGAQVVIDQFIAGAEDKWNQKSGLVLLLPHGYEGQGPEHSSARYERFLQLCARGNLQVVYPSTPAQYFHLLRRQALRRDRKPLVVLTPKSLLRLPEAVSALESLSSGSFHRVLGDPREPAGEKVRRLVFTTGKLYYDLDAARRESPAADAVALVRIEELYPYPRDAVRGILARYPRAKEVVWAQEEPRNMGAWSYLAELLREDLRPDQTLSYAGRPATPSPATGSHKRHLAEQQAIVDEALRVNADARGPARGVPAAI